MSYHKSLRGPIFHPGRVVAPADDLASVQAVDDGRLVPRETLGPGLVERVTSDGRVCVYWLTAEVVACVDPADLRIHGDDAHLISVYRCDGQGQRILQRRSIVETAGLTHNWAIERRPRRVVRAIRNDGMIWTFRISFFGSGVNADWSEPPEDADAEALTAVELGVR